MFNIIQPGSTEMLMVGSNPNFNPTFDIVRSIKGGTETPDQQYAHLTNIIQQDGERDLIGAIAWNPSTREVWTAGQNGEIRKYKEWLSDFSSGGTFVTRIPNVNGDLYGGAHAGGVGSPSTKNNTLNTFVVIVGNTKLVAVNMTTGAAITWYDLNSNSQHSIESFTDICPLGTDHGRPEGVVVVGTRLNGRGFTARVEGVNQLSVIDTTELPTFETEGTTESTTREIYIGPWYNGTDGVVVSLEKWDDQTHFETNSNHPFGGIQHYVESGICEVWKFGRSEFNVLYQRRLFSYTIPTKVETITHPDGFVIEQNRYRLGGPSRTWEGLFREHNPTLPSRLFHYRHDVGLFVIDIRTDMSNSGLLPSFNPESQTASYRNNLWWANPITQSNRTFSTGSYLNITVPGPGTMPWYKL